MFPHLITPLRFVLPPLIDTLNYYVVVDIYMWYMVFFKVIHI